MREFKEYHPFVSLAYFVFVIGFSVFFMNPVCLAISFLCGFLYSAILTGKTALKLNFAYILPMMLTAIVINVLFNHEGMTVIAFLPSGNPLTLEAFLYGLFAAVMLAAVIAWFSCYNVIMTSDKHIYLFGKIIPSLALIFSMILSFVPRFAAHFKKVNDVQNCLCRQPQKLSAKLKTVLSVFSATLTWAFENSIDTADSMKARGYGLSGRTTFSVFKFSKRDACVLALIIFCGGYVIFGKILGGIDFSYFPAFEHSKITGFSMSIFGAYLLLCIMPIVIEIWEVWKWKHIK